MSNPSLAAAKADIEAQFRAGTLPPLTRHQRRHAAEEVAYREAVIKQGTRYVRGFHNNPKGAAHVGAKQLAKQRAKEEREDHAS